MPKMDNICKYCSKPLHYSDEVVCSIKNILVDQLWGDSHPDFIDSFIPEKRKTNNDSYKYRREQNFHEYMKLLSEKFTSKQLPFRWIGIQFLQKIYQVHIYRSIAYREAIGIFGIFLPCKLQQGPANLTIFLITPVNTRRIAIQATKYMPMAY